jgi:hypothetical protein
LTAEAEVEENKLRVFQEPVEAEAEVTGHGAVR